MKTQMEDSNVTINDSRDSHEFNDERAPFDDYTLFEMKHDNQIDVINNFKTVISKEPEFYGIYSISSFKILDIFKNSDKLFLKNEILTKNQVGMFKSVYYELFEKNPDEFLVQKIGYNIMIDIYVN